MEQAPELILLDGIWSLALRTTEQICFNIFFKKNRLTLFQSFQIYSIRADELLTNGCTTETDSMKEKENYKTSICTRYRVLKVKNWCKQVWGVTSVTRLGDLLDFGQVFKALRNN